MAKADLGQSTAAIQGAKAADSDLYEYPESGSEPVLAYKPPPGPSERSDPPGDPWGRWFRVRVSTGLDLVLAAVVAIILILGSYRGGGPRNRRGKGWNW